MYVVTWNNERLEEFEEQFEDIYEASCFIENLPDNAMLFYEDDVRVVRLI